LGECGRRGGYFQLSPAVDNGTRDQLYKLASVNLCPNVDGQIMIDLMVNPPQQGDASYELYISERGAILHSLKRRAEKLVNMLNSLEGVTCQKAEGAMYAFPSITVPPLAVLEAKKRNIAPDMLYAFELLESAGVCVVAGSGFGQKDGSYHFRTTFLPSEEKLDAVVERVKLFHTAFTLKYSSKDV
jgi:alanine transaminase